VTSTDGLVAALARAQSNFGTIAKNHENPHFKSKYADLSDVLAVVRPALNAEGILLSQPLQTDDDGRVRLYTILEGHGECRSASLPVHLDNMTPQQLLSTLTYYRRGMLAALLAVAAEDDDDGNAAQTAPQARQEPVAVIPDMSKPLASMSIAELRGAAREVKHDFGTGAISKAEMIRQLEPLVRAASGAEPFDVTPADVVAFGKRVHGLTDEPEQPPFEPVLAKKQQDAVKRGGE
jgi:hypothetical protein